MKTLLRIDDDISVKEIGEKLEDVIDYDILVYINGSPVCRACISDMGRCLSDRTIHAIKQGMNAIHLSVEW